MSNSRRAAKAWTPAQSGDIQPRSYSKTMHPINRRACIESFSGSFELRGNPQIGELDLLTPLGQIVMQLRWQPDIAEILRGTQRQIFANADELIQRATGASLPMAQLFAWLEGKNTSVGVGDWQVDLANHANGRIIARRSLPTPAVLRIALEMP